MPANTPRKLPVHNPPFFHSVTVDPLVPVSVSASKDMYGEDTATWPLNDDIPKAVPCVGTDVMVVGTMPFPR